jgi:hypothetical protein
VICEIRGFKRKLQMIDFKRIAYLLLLAMGVGLAMVQVRSSHLRTVYETTRLMEQQRQELRQMQRRQTQVSRAIQSPERIRDEVVRLGLRIQPPGTTPESIEKVAKRQ